MTIYTTLRILKDAGACTDGYKLLRAGLPPRHGMDEPIPLAHGLCSNPMEHVLWAISYVHPDCEVERDKLARLFACECAERVLPIFERKFPNDSRPRQAIEVSRRFARGQATEEERSAAWAAAWAAAWDVAWDVARDVAWDVARAAARDVARAASRAAARDAAWDVAWDVARDAERKAQSEILFRLLTRGE
jgi:hypothetical protein